MLQNGSHWFPGPQMRTSEAQRSSPAPSHTDGERYLRASEWGPAQGLDIVYLTCPCSAVCDPMDCSPPGPSVHGILQARILEWVTMPSSGRSSWPDDWIWVSCLLHWQVSSLPLTPLGWPRLQSTGSQGVGHSVGTEQQLQLFCIAVKVCFNSTHWSLAFLSLDSFNNLLPCCSSNFSSWYFLFWQTMLQLMWN